MNRLQIELEGEHTILATRRFPFPPELVYRAHIEPALLRRWMTGPPGWQMTECEIDARPGGRILHAWSDQQGNSFSITGEFVELEAPRRIVHVQRMHLPDPTPDNHITAHFEPDGDGTVMTMRMQLPDAATRQAMLDTGMADGMESSYGSLERVCGEADA